MPSRRHNILLFALLFIALLVYLLNELAQVHFYYWTFWWYDIMMHFLGGFLVSGIALWAFIRFTPPSSLQIKNALYVSVATALVVGIGWEFFEYFAGMYVAQVHIVTDTAGDLIMDTIGAVVSWGIIRPALTRGERTIQSI